QTGRHRLIGVIVPIIVPSIFIELGYDFVISAPQIIQDFFTAQADSCTRPQSEDTMFQYGQIMTGIHPKSSQISLPQFEIKILDDLKIKLFHHLPVYFCTGPIADVGVVNEGIVKYILQFQSDPLRYIRRCIEFFHRGGFDGITVLSDRKLGSETIIESKREIDSRLSE